MILGFVLSDLAKRTPMYRNRYGSQKILEPKICCFFPNKSPVLNYVKEIISWRDEPWWPSTLIDDVCIKNVFSRHKRSLNIIKSTCEKHKMNDQLESLNPLNQINPINPINPVHRLKPILWICCPLLIPSNKRPPNIIKSTCEERSTTS